MTQVCSLLGSFGLGFALSLASLSATANAASGRLLSCRVPFDYDSAAVEEEFVDLCIKNLRLTSRDTLQVVASATPQGTAAYNAALSKRRAENLKKAFTARVPGLEVRAIAIGAVPRNGLLARATTPETSTTATAGLTGSVKAASSASLGSWKVGPRMGRDRTRVEEKTQYFAPGIEIAYLPPLANPELYVELGALANAYTYVDNTKMTSIHLAPMLGFKEADSGFIAGIRGLGGIVSSNISGNELGDAGAELRLGKETPNWTAFLGVGQTRVLQRVGIDLGYKF